MRKARQMAAMRRPQQTTGEKVGLERSMAMRWTKNFIFTLRQDPADAEVISHRLMMRAGLISKVATAIYNYLPLGWRTVEKLDHLPRGKVVNGNGR
ncbi:MAG: hypothetical protein K8R59_04985, partial [Thermoanaerobaculales bacterium]|nr:hypothetical protein [Thermoanaerobaculales bacterium]